MASQIDSNYHFVDAILSLMVNYSFLDVIFRFLQPIL